MPFGSWFVLWPVLVLENLLESGPLQPFLSCKFYYSDRCLGPSDVFLPLHDCRRTTLQLTLLRWIFARHFYKGTWSFDSNLKRWSRRCQFSSYYCHGTNTKRKHDFVSVPPNIEDYQTSSDAIVREGSNVTLTCKATGSPTPTISWKRDDNQQISINKTLSGGYFVRTENIIIYIYIYRGDPWPRFDRYSARSGLGN